MALIPIPGDWYIATTCKDCKCKILLFHDLNNGKSNLKGSFALVCPRCECKGSFKAEHYQYFEKLKSNTFVASRAN